MEAFINNMMDYWHYNLKIWKKMLRTFQNKLKMSRKSPKTQFKKVQIY